MVAARSLREQRLPALLAGLADGVPDLQVNGLQADSRRVQAGDLFLACQGLTHHGLDYLDQVLAQGAAAVAWEPQPGRTPPQADVPLVAVEALSVRAGEVAGRYFGAPSERLHVTGITGTDGKTSTAYLLAQALDRLQQPCGYLGTLGAGRIGALSGGEHTTPDPVALQARLAEFVEQQLVCAAMEVSSHALDQARVAGVSFDVAVLTNLGRDHLDYHGDLSRYAAAKHRLFRWPGLQAAVLNRDDNYGRAWAHELAEGLECVSYGIDGAGGRGARHVLARDVRSLEDGLAFTVDTSWGRAELRCGLLGRFNVYNLLAALSVLLLRGVELGDAVQALGQVQTVPGRMEGHRIAGGPTLVVDYAHTPQALEQALLAARAHCRGHLSCVFGCGGDRDVGKRPLMGQVAARLADASIVTDDNPRSEAPQQITDQIVAAMGGANCQVIHDREAAIAAALSGAGEGDLILIAGKGHEDYQIRGAERRHYSDREVVSRLVQAVQA